MVRISLPCAWCHHAPKTASLIVNSDLVRYRSRFILHLQSACCGNIEGNVLISFYLELCFFFNFSKDLTKPFFSSKKLVQVLGSSSNASSGGMEDPLEKVVYVLTSNSFQKWILSQDEPDKMFYNCDLETCAKQAFATHLWFQENPDPEWIKVWLVSFTVYILYQFRTVISTSSKNVRISRNK